MKTIYKIVILLYIISLLMWIHGKYLDTWDKSKVNKHFNGIEWPQVIHAHYLGGFGIQYLSLRENEDGYIQNTFYYDGSTVYIGKLNDETDISFEANEDEKKVIYYLLERSTSISKHSALMRFRGYPIDYIRYYFFLPPILFLGFLTIIFTAYIRLRLKQRKKHRTSGST